MLDIQSLSDLRLCHDDAPAVGGVQIGNPKNASGPVNATCDFQFNLWDAASRDHLQ